MAWYLILLPLVAAIFAWLAPSDGPRARVVSVAGFLHLAGVVFSLTLASTKGWETLPRGVWLGLDALGGWVLLVISVLFLICSLYVPAYLRHFPERNHKVFALCLLAFLSMASLVTQARHPGLVWVGMETTTLTSAPLIYFNHNRRSLEATWKYVIIGSVGIALALLGTFFVAYSAYMGDLEEPLQFTRLMQEAGHFSVPWLRAGFVLTMVGYGTKMGLAPLHTWKPDAYNETPGIVGALLAGGVTSCAFLALLRIYGIMAAAGETAFARELMIGFGLLSMAWAMVFMVRQRGFKRMLAYSSVEHMGILVLGIGMGGVAARFALYHLAANALTKSVLFMASGNIDRAYDSTVVPEVSGAIRRCPVSAWLFLIAFLAITGTPPFSPFISEFNIAAAAFAQGQTWLGVAFLVLLGCIFLAMSDTVVKMIFGTPSTERKRTKAKETFGTTAPLILALGLSLVLGLWLPRPLETMLFRASAWVEGQP